MICMLMNCKLISSTFLSSFAYVHMLSVNSTHSLCTFAYMSQPSRVGLVFSSFHQKTHDLTLRHVLGHKPTRFLHIRTTGSIGWLFLFAVLMAAGLLFTMVFFVRSSPKLFTIVPSVHNFRSVCMTVPPCTYRSSCSRTWNATTLIL